MSEKERLGIATAKNITVTNGVTINTIGLTVLAGTVSAPTLTVNGLQEGKVKVALANVDTAGGVAKFANPVGAPILITRVFLDVSTASTGACTLSVGTAANGTTLSANLIDTLSVASTGTFDNVTDKSTNGKSRQKMTASQFITVSTASGASAGLVGNLYIEWIAA